MMGFPPLELLMFLTSCISLRKILAFNLANFDGCPGLDPDSIKAANTGLDPISNPMICCGRQCRGAVKGIEIKKWAAELKISLFLCSSY
jgi:hypothetical protein